MKALWMIVKIAISLGAGVVCGWLSWAAAALTLGNVVPKARQYQYEKWIDAVFWLGFLAVAGGLAFIFFRKRSPT